MQREVRPHLGGHGVVDRSAAEVYPGFREPAARPHVHLDAGCPLRVDGLRDRIGERATTGAVSSAAGGAASGAVHGSVAAGAERGAAGCGARGLVRGLLREAFRAKKPSKPYRSFVRRCLKERGYDLIGWE